MRQVARPGPGGQSVGPVSKPSTARRVWSRLQPLPRGVRREVTRVARCGAGARVGAGSLRPLYVSRTSRGVKSLARPRPWSSGISSGGRTSDRLEGAIQSVRLRFTRMVPKRDSLPPSGVSNSIVARSQAASRWVGQR